MKPSKLAEINRLVWSNTLEGAETLTQFCKELIEHIEEIEQENESLQSEVDELNEKLEGK